MSLALVFVLALSGGPDEDRLRAELEALGYLDSAPTDNPEQQGVTINRPEAFKGLNLLSSRHRATAHLMAMDGEILHTWAGNDTKPWMHVEMHPDGSLLVLSKDNFIAKLGWDSKVRWRHDTRVHHDFDTSPDGRVFLLSRQARLVSISGFGELPVLADQLEILDKKGHLEKTIPLFELFADAVPKARLWELKRLFKSGVPLTKLARPEATGDLTHTNSIQVLRRRIRGIAPAGAVLLSFRELDLVAIVDIKRRAVVWRWGVGELEGQHHATLQARGRITIFDNGVRRGASRLLDLDPHSGSILWSFTATDFFTRLRGAYQKLPNGNALATLSDSGHVLEINPEGDVVWELWNPEVRKVSGRSERAVIYRLVRYPRSALSPALLRTLKASHRRSRQKE